MEKKILREVCELVGVTRRMIQGYEKAGLVVATDKNLYGYLLYDEKEIERIKLIKMYRDFGFSIKEVKLLFETPKDKYKELMMKKLWEMKKEILELQMNIKKVEDILTEYTY